MTDTLHAELVTLDDLQAVARVLRGTGAFRGAYTFLVGMNPVERAHAWPGLMRLIADVPPYAA